METNFTKNEL